MRSWREPYLYEGSSTSRHRLHLRDTATGELRSINDRSPRIYVCGITPYDSAHLGHALSAVVYDVVVRALRDQGATPIMCQNVTDVDDPLFVKARELDVNWQELVTTQTDVYRRAVEHLGVIPPDHYVAASEVITEIEQLCLQLQARGLTYWIDGSLYLDHGVVGATGASTNPVSGLDTPAMLVVAAERGLDVERPGKHHPLDQLLWKPSSPDEPAWSGRLGAGRPGWHVECVAIARDRLGASTIAIQGGGSDLIYPHHDSCALLVSALDGTPLAETYVHVEMLHLDGHKMSKSLGNLVTVGQLADRGYSGAEIRLALLSHRYTAPIYWSDDDLASARSRLTLWADAVTRAPATDASATLDACREAIANDLDTPRCIELIDEWAAGQRTAATPSTSPSTEVTGEELFHWIHNVLGIDRRVGDDRR